MSMSITNYSGAAAAALAGLNNVTSQMTDTQTRINTGKVINGYADDPAVFHTATVMNRQVDLLKASALDMNASLNNINSALGTGTSVANSLQTIKSTLTHMTASGTNARVRQDDASKIAALINAINGSVGDAIAAAGASGKVSLLDNPNNDMVVNLGGSGTTVTVGASSLYVADSTTAKGVTPQANSIRFNAADVQALLTALTANAKPATLAPVVSDAGRGAAAGTFTTNSATSTSTVVIEAIDTNDAATLAKYPSGFKMTVTTTNLGAATAAVSFLAAVNTSIANVDQFNKQLGGAVASINAVLSNNKALQSSLTSGVSDLVDADLSVEQAKMQALQFQQQVSVSAVSSINQSRQALLSLFC
jgi:flagellin